MRSFTRLGLGSAALFLAVLVSGVVHPRTATVIVSLPPQLATATATVTGSRDSAYFPSRQVNVSVSDRLRVPTSTAEAGTYASGQVVFWHYSTCTRDCSAMYEMPANYELLSRTGVAYRTLADLWWKEGTISKPVPIRAELPGPAGNTGPHTIFQTRLWPGWMVPDNPEPITGGASRIVHKVAQTDVDGALASLHGRLASEIQNAITVNASVLAFKVDGEPSYTYSTDHAVGEVTPTVTVTMTASVSINGFSDALARRLIASAIRLHDGPVKTSYVVEQLSSNGDVRLRGFAAAFTIASPDRATWQRRLVSMSPDGARAELLRAFPGSEVEIRTFGAPALPGVPDRIKLVFEPLPSYPA